MSEWWSPKPLRPPTTDNLFSYDDDAPIAKSAPANRWVQQRELDGTPHTRSGVSALVPPAAGPKLFVGDDVGKAIAADDGPPKGEKEKDLKPDDVVKAYLNVSRDLIAKGQRAMVKEAEEKSLSAEDDPREIEKAGLASNAAGVAGSAVKQVGRSVMSLAGGSSGGGGRK